MGTDIHGVFQRRVPQTGAWEDIPHRYEMGRHYQLFAVLAGVRNGTGFAGVVTGEAVKPISEPRGYPDGFVSRAPRDAENLEPGDDPEELEDDRHPATHAAVDPRRQKYYAPEAVRGIWMGDHSFSWLSGEEMLAWHAKAPIVVAAGVLERAAYEAWDKESEPESYCGGVGGAGVRVIEEPQVGKPGEPKNWTHVRVTWDRGLKSDLAYFFDEVWRLAAEHGDIRFVFGFDS